MTKTHQRRLAGKRIAILATDGFEQSELEDPRDAFSAEGAETFLVSPHTGEIHGSNHGKRGHKIVVDRVLEDAMDEEFDALLLPGGVASPDALRTVPQAIDFIRKFVASDKPVLAICHGPWTLIDADAVKGRTLTSWPSLKADLTNAGASWVDRETVVDGKLVTARKPDDLPTFIETSIQLLSGEAAVERAA